MSKLKQNLTKIILQDLFTAGRTSVFLLSLVLLNAIGVVYITHYSRQEISEKNQILLERDKLSNEWRNLLLEETALSDHSRIYDIAKKELGMKRPSTGKEIVITL
ncbi:cell division protein [Candidatus Photodesmus katoptron]|uniref:Cell division protein FtsL n=1 Tax=Candidatus Photodesmus katoptron Akat1 TaxID=1236703 RepID=S3DKT2_9GAMM|nr:cell division protein FtsL [Candidatus Photodesmus katoptron]EPE37729.1 cell division protein FtsL [Candidatus Photodesmus katoptron Akat1]KEY90549.1 cell division protein [Candidatus Photodesmus katoptron]